MKNLPENEFWKAISHRLDIYEEDPGDDWNRIAGAMIAGSASTEKFNRYADVVTSIVLAFVLGFQVALQQGSVSTDDKIIAEQPGHKRASGKVYAENKAPVEGESSLFAQQQSSVHPHSSSIHTGQIRQELNDRAAAFEADDTDEDDQVEVSDIIQEGISGVNDQQDLMKDTILVPTKLRPDTSVVNGPVPAEKKKKKKRFQPSVYLQLAPSMAYQKVIPKRDDEITILKLNSPGVISSNRFGWSAEMGFQMLVSPRLELYAALSWYQQQQTVSYAYTSNNNSMLTQPSDDSWSYYLTPGSATNTFRYDMRNAGISVGALYFLNGRKLMHKIGGGIHYQKGLLRCQENDSYTNSDSNYIGYQLLYRLEYAFDRRLNFFMQPVFMHTVFSNEKLDEPFIIKPYRAGLGFGVVYHFR